MGSLVLTCLLKQNETYLTSNFTLLYLTLWRDFHFISPVLHGRASVALIFVILAVLAVVNLYFVDFVVFAAARIA